MNRLPKIIFTLLTVFAVMAMVLWPAATGHGSFQAVNGPTTVFAALRSALLLSWLIVAFGTTVLTLATTALPAALPEQQARQSIPLLC